ncbi:hypothetical protein NE865_00726 [Phthorimaea operculella]|nr:hypothetical protein NE865_00726 [Phthorimaea operculella]
MKCAHAKCTENLDEEETFCTHCQNHYHYKCANITEMGYNRKNADLKAAWRCPTCKSGGNNGAESGITLNDVIQELKRFRAFIEPKVSATSDSLEVMKKQWVAMDSRVKVAEERISSAEDRISTLSNLPQDLKLAKESIAVLMEENNAQSQFSRINNVEIAGVPFIKKENLFEVLNSISTQIGFTLNNSDVDTIHRVRRFDNASSKPDDAQHSRPPAIVVRFTQRRRKDAFLAASRTHRSLSTADIGIAGPASRIFINHHLTPANKLLLKEAKNLKSTLQYQCWHNH